MTNRLPFHLPRYEELPDLEMYMDQILNLLNRYLEPLKDPHDEVVVTKTMINNYVKHKVLPSPTKKRYTKDHLAYLIVICILKNTYAMTEIKKLIELQMTGYPIDHTYNYFCNEFEATLYATFKNEPITHMKSNLTGPKLQVLQNVILSTTTKIYVQQTLDKEGENL